MLEPELNIQQTTTNNKTLKKETLKTKQFNFFSQINLKLPQNP